MKTIKLGNDEFGVDIDGTVHQPRRVSPTDLDNVRVFAAQEYLSDRSLTRDQRRYWSAVALISPPHQRLAP